MSSYHSITDVYKRPFHSSMVGDLIDKTPARVKYDIENGGVRTKTLSFGSLFHCLLLEPNKLEERFVMEPIEDGKTINRNRKDYRQWKAEQTKELFSIEQLNKCIRMEAAIKNQKHIAKIFEAPGQAELEVKARIPPYGIECAVTIDRLSNGVPYDLKKVRDGGAVGFGKSIENYYYDSQAALYVDVLIAADFELKYYGENPLFVWVCIEEEHPHLASLYYATAMHFYEGRRKYIDAMKIWRECLKNEEFPGYAQTPIAPEMSYRYTKQHFEDNS